MNKEITKIVRQYPKTDDCKFETLKELWDWQEGQIEILINNARHNKVGVRLNKTSLIGI